jgi:ADP-ribose pyrophosphatase YjhB (NUDIX family)
MTGANAFMGMTEAIAALQNHVYRNGDLPEELFLFVSSITPLINVDLLVKDDNGRTLLTWRDDDYYGAGWHIPGGVIRYKEHARDRIQKVAEQELGCAVLADPVPMLIQEAFDQRPERGHFISLLYKCRLAGEPAPGLRAIDVPAKGQWRWHDQVPPDLLPVHLPYARFIEAS